MTATYHQLTKYTKYYEPKKFWHKIEKVTAVIGEKVVFQFVALYFILSDKKTPFKIKATIIAALGYFILPADLVADIIPVFGFTDDIAFLSYAFTKAHSYLTDDIRNKAEDKTEELFA